MLDLPNLLLEHLKTEHPKVKWEIYPSGWIDAVVNSGYIRLFTRSSFLRLTSSKTNPYHEVENIKSSNVIRFIWAIDKSKMLKSHFAEFAAEDPADYQKFIDLVKQIVTDFSADLVPNCCPGCLICFEHINVIGNE